MIPLASPRLMLALGLALAFVLNGFYWNARGHNAERIQWQARIAQERATAAANVLAIERHNQEVTNAASTDQAARLARINRDLRADLDRLRQRPERAAGVPETGRPACAGGTGAELSRPDAEFLAGQAARADELRAGLIACYAVIDGAAR